MRICLSLVLDECSTLIAKNKLTKKERVFAVNIVRMPMGQYPQRRVTAEKAKITFSSLKNVNNLPLLI